MNAVAIKENVSPVTKWNPRKEAVGREITYIDIGSVSQDSKQITNENRMLGDEAPSRARQIISQGDILVSTVRPNLNAVALVPEHLDGATASTGFCVLRPIKDRLDNRYLFHWVKALKFIASMTGQATGQSYPAVSDKIVKSSEIPLPSLEHQKRIAAILDQADKLRRLRQTAITKLNTLGQSIFYEMFGAFHDDFSDWPVHRLETFVTDAQIGAVRAAKEMGDDKPVEYIRMDSIGMAGGLSFEGLKRVDASEADRRKYALLVGDFLFNTRNSKELVGKTAVVRAPFDGIYNNNILRLRFSDAMTADFLDAFLRTRKGQTVLGAIKSGTTSVFAIYQKSFMALDVPVPPKDLQLQYSERLRELFVVQEKNARAYMHASSLLASLQHRAFRGEL